MSWELKVLQEFEKDILNPIVEEVREIVEEQVEAEGGDPEDYIGEAISQVVDSQLIYNIDMLAAIQAYCDVGQVFVENAYDPMYSEIYEKVLES